jgi:predicted nucleotidyltransferase
MRLTSRQHSIIKKYTTEIFGLNTRLLLFGSRVDDNKKGGDIDLYIETQELEPFDKKIQLLRALQRELGEQKIDIVINNFTKQKEIYRVAKQTGIEL